MPESDRSAGGSLIAGILLGIAGAFVKMFEWDRRIRRVARKTFQIGGIVAFVLFGLMQLARPVRHNRKINPADTIEGQLHPPPAVAQVLTACRDCHTDNTHWRWYTNVAPVSWLTDADVNVGRRHLDLSEWAKYKPGQQVDKLQGMCKLVRSGDMPLWYYKPLHIEAWLTADDWQPLCRWTDQQVKRLKTEDAGR